MKNKIDKESEIKSASKFLSNNLWSIYENWQLLSKESFAENMQRRTKEFIEERRRTDELSLMRKSLQIATIGLFFTTIVSVIDLILKLFYNK